MLKAGDHGLSSNMPLQIAEKSSKVGLKKLMFPQILITSLSNKI